MKTLSLTNLDRITELDLNRSSSTNAVGGRLSISKFINLQVLKAAYNDLTEITFSQSDNTTVTELDLSNNLLTEISNVDSLTGLETVNLSNNTLPTSDIDSVLTNLVLQNKDNGTVLLGGTNALPTLGNYNTAKTTLVNRGWTVEIPGGIDTEFSSTHGYTSTNEAVREHPDWEGRPKETGTPEQWEMDGANNKITCEARFKNIRTRNPIMTKVGSLIRWEVEFDFGPNTLQIDETEHEVITIANTGSFSVGDTVTQTNVTNGVSHTVEGLITDISPSGFKVRIGPPAGQADISVTPSNNDLDGSPNSTNFKVTDTGNGISNVTIGSESFEVTIVQDNKTQERTAMFSLVDMHPYEANLNEGVMAKPNMSIIVKFVKNATTNVDQVTAFFRKTGFTNGVGNSVTIGGTNMTLASVEGSKRLRISADIDVKQSAAATTIACSFKNVTDNETLSSTINLDKNTNGENDFYNALAGITTERFSTLYGFKLSLQAGALEDTNIDKLNVYKALAKSVGG